MEQPNKVHAIHVEGVDQEAIAHKVSETMMFILEKTGTGQDINVFANELHKEVEKLFTPDERTYLAMMYCAGNLMKVLQNTPLGSMFKFNRNPEGPTGPKPKTSPDESA